MANPEIKKEVSINGQFPEETPMVFTVEHEGQFSYIVHNNNAVPVEQIGQDGVWGN